MKCRYCGRENVYPAIAVRGIVSSGGYATLSNIAVGKSGTHGALCTCERLVQSSYAEPVPLGIYRTTQPTYLTQESDVNSSVIMKFNKDKYVRVVETRVELGCVRGRVDLVGTVTKMKSVTGWISLLEPQSRHWAEYVNNGTLTTLQLEAKCIEI